MNVLMVAFDPTRATPVVGGHNEGLNLRKVVADSKVAGTGDTGERCNVVGRKRELWNCGGDHLKRNCPKPAKEKTQKDEGGE